MTRIIYLGNARDFDKWTARCLSEWFYDRTGNRAFWVNSGDKGTLVIHPRAKA